MVPKKLKDLFFEEITAYGGALLYVFTLVIGLITKNLELVLELLIGLGLLYIIAIIIRSFYFKERPKKRTFKTFLGKMDASAFPSLHSARAVFFTFTVKDLFQVTYIFYFLLFISFIVGYSRIYLKHHYWKDVLFGFLLGYLVYLFVARILF